ncbi:MAG: hypothetical protein ABJ382_12295 [Ilumatobacter sp.]
MGRRRARVVVAAIALAVGTAACAGGSDAVPPPSDSGPATTPVPVPVATDAFSVTSEPPVTDPPAAASFADGPLADVCGDSVVIQASDFPEVGLGPLYALLGPSPVVDPVRNAVSAPLVRADGVVEATTLEIRSGGPTVGFQSAVAVMADDDTIDLALDSLAVAARDRSILETHAVVPLTDRPSDAVIVAPGTHPDVTDYAALRTEGIEVRHITDAPVIRFLAATGVLSSEQLVGGSDGLPASFVEADGVVAQQGDLTIDPVLLASIPRWARPVVALPASDAGWRSLDDVLLADAVTERVSDECLGRLVRVIQQSITAYATDPEATNVVMSDVRGQFDPLEPLTPTLFDFATELAIEGAVFDLARTDAPGTVDTVGLDSFLVDLAAALEVGVVSVDDLVDDRFVDPTVSR